MHDWKQLFSFRFNISAPVFPATEVSVTTLNSKKETTKGVFWNADHNNISIFSAIILPVFYNVLSEIPIESIDFYVSKQERASWISKVPWLPAKSQMSVAATARQSSGHKQPPVFVSSDQTSLTFALFYDKNSSFNCFQAVLMQNGRIRAVHAHPKQPWAVEVRDNAFLSLVFYRLPFPQQIISLSIYPVSGKRLGLLQNEGLVSFLIFRGLLKLRPSTEYDPSSFDLPEISY